MRPLTTALLALIALAVCRSVLAFDSVVLTADAMATGTARLTGLRIALELPPAATPSARISAARVDLGRRLGRYTAVDLSCARLRIAAGRIECEGGALRAQGGILHRLTAKADATFDPSRGRLAFDAGDLAIAGGRAQVSGTVERNRWAIRGHGTRLEASALRALAVRWIRVPEYTLTGLIDVDFDAASAARAIRIGATARTAGLDLSNAAGSVAAEKLAAIFTVTAQVAPQGLVWQTEAQGRGGQLLVGPMLADFGANPLKLHASGILSGRTLDIDAFSLALHALIDAVGTARLTLATAPGAIPEIDRAHVQVTSLEFPAAYTSFLQLPLAATDFGALRTSGRAEATLDIVEDHPVRIDAAIERLDIADPGSRLAADDLTGALHWVAAGVVAPSFLSFRDGRAYGIEIGATRLEFRTRGLGFGLLRPTRIPVFDGALVVRKLSAAELGRPEARVAFDATIEPIGMPQLCKAFGWPQMQGSLSGRVPGLAYRNREVTFGGDVVAHVFAGTIHGSNIRLTDPLGPWPRLRADVSARDLDLGLVTRTFPIGSITGRLDADVTGLDLFDWSPVAFDAKLYTAPGDASSHLISQKAVTSLSNLGGGGGIVAAALHSGVLRFFRTFHYDRIGVRCVLANEVCLMSGIEPADGGGYYIVKGRGLPRIDIIGNQGSVNWPQLVSQIVSAMHGGDLVVH